jgi:glutathione synthase
VVQEFLPEVMAGDKRIVLVDGEALGAVNRVPQADDIRSNMVRGGRAELAALTPKEQEICARIGPELKRRGLVFVGIDVIADRITEINVTSPTGLRAIKRLGGPDLAAALWDAIERRAAAR